MVAVQMRLAVSGRLGVWWVRWLCDVTLSCRHERRSVVVTSSGSTRTTWQFLLPPLFNFQGGDTTWTASGRNRAGTIRLGRQWRLSTVLFEDTVSCWVHIASVVDECNDTGGGNPNFLEIHLSQCHSVHHKCHVDWRPTGDFEMGLGQICKCKKWINLRSSLFWDVTHRRLVVIYRRFGTTYMSSLQESASRLDRWRMGR